MWAKHVKKFLPVAAAAVLPVWKHPTVYGFNYSAKCMMDPDAGMSREALHTQVINEQMQNSKLGSIKKSMHQESLPTIKVRTWNNGELPNSFDVQTMFKHMNLTDRKFATESQARQSRWTTFHKMLFPADDTDVIACSFKKSEKHQKGIGTYMKHLTINSRNIRKR